MYINCSIMENRKLTDVSDYESLVGVTWILKLSHLIAEKSIQFGDQVGMAVIRVSHLNDSGSTQSSSVL